MKWNDEDYEALLKAIEDGDSLNEIVEIAVKRTKKSHISVTKKLMKIGCLKVNGLSFSMKKGSGMLH